MQIFNDMNQELRAQTGGRVGFKIFGGFALGDEMDVLRKLRIGYVHAAAFTTASLSDLNPDMRVLQIPFLFNTYDEVDHVLEALAETSRRVSPRKVTKSWDGPSSALST